MKKILVVLLTFGMLCGCQGKKDENVVRIGAILPLTGTIGSAGIDSKNGLELAINHGNQMLKDYNYTLEITYEDHKSSAKDAVVAINKLLTINDVDIVYCQLTNTSLAIKPIVTEKKVPTFAVSGAIDLLENTQYLYRNYINPHYYADKTLNCISKTFIDKDICVVYSNTDFGRSMFEGIQKATIESDINILTSYAYDDSSGDYKNLVYKILSENPNINVIYVAGVGRNLGVLIKQLKQLGFKGNIVGGIELPYDEVLSIIGEDKTNVYYIDFAFSADDTNNQMSQNFSQDYLHEYGKVPNTSAALAYDAIMIIVNVIRDGEGFSNIDTSLDGVTGLIKVRKQEIYHELKLKKL